MTDVTIRISSNGIRDLLRSSGIKDDLEQRARRIAEHAGPGNVAEARIGRNRAHASVTTTTIEAMIAQQYHNKLSQAVDAGR